MGTYSNSNFGKIRGKVGEGVGSKWRGVNVLRSLPAKSGKPASPAQLAVHGKFALAAAQLSPIKDVLNLGFGDRKLNKLTGYNAAVRLFLAEAVTGSYPDYTVDYPRMTISRGSLAPAYVTVAQENGLSFSWAPDLNDFNSFGSDRMVFVIFNQTRKTYRLNNGHSREELGFSIPNAGTIGDVLHIWSFCARHDGRTVSPSEYVGTVTLTV